MKRSDARPSASRNLQTEVGVGVTEFSGVPAYNPEQQHRNANMSQQFDLSMGGLACHANWHGRNIYVSL